VLRGVALLCDKAEEPLLGLVVGAVGDLVERILVQHLLRLGLLHGHPVHGDGQLDLGRLGLVTLRLLDLLVELELLDALLHHVDPLGCVHLRAAQKLKYGQMSIGIIFLSIIFMQRKCN
jgi:hypothetical protein